MKCGAGGGPSTFRAKLGTGLLLSSALSIVPEIVTEMRRFGAKAGHVLGSPDGRWTLVSTSMTVSVAVAVTWLALGAVPASSARTYEPKAERAALPYDLLLHLAGIGSLPAIASEVSAHYQTAGLIGAPNFAGPLDRMLAAERAATTPPVETRTLKVDNGDTIIGMLQEAGVSQRDATAVVEAIRPLYSPRNIKSGQTFKATFGSVKDAAPPSANEPTPLPITASDEASVSDRLLSLSFSPDVERQITVRLSVPDGYLAENVNRPLEARYQHAGGVIESSLYLSATQAGIPAGVVVEMIRMFSYDVDFQRDVHEGDSFDVMFNRYFTEDGAPAKTGDVMAASMTLGGKKRMLYRFETADGAEYFDAKGQSAKAMLMKTPVDGARISSTFGARRHPILGYTRMHKGVDFAVPRGTPVMAAGNGTVAYAGTASGYGNLVIIRHGNGYSTAYGHLSRYGSGVRTGARVRQGQIVAYSGMTGLATGPHLHYEVRANDKQVNPATVKVASGRTLEGREMVGFVEERGRIETLLASLPMQTKLADAAGLLRESSMQ